MPTQAKRKRRFVICIRTDDADLLTPRRIYEVLPDDGAAKLVARASREKTLTSAVMLKESASISKIPGP